MQVSQDKAEVMSSRFQQLLSCKQLEKVNFNVISTASSSTTTSTPSGTTSLTPTATPSKGSPRTPKGQGKAKGK